MKNIKIKIISWDYYQDKYDKIRPMFYFSPDVRFLLRNPPNQSDKLYDYNGNRLDNDSNTPKEITISENKIYNGKHLVYFKKTNASSACSTSLNSDPFFFSAFLYNTEWKDISSLKSDEDMGYFLQSETENFDPDEGYKKDERKKEVENFDPDEGFDLAEVDKKNKELEAKKKHREEERKAEDEQEEGFRENFESGKKIVKRGYDKILTLDSKTIFIGCFLVLCFFVFAGDDEEDKGSQKKKP